MSDQSLAFSIILGLDFLSKTSTIINMDNQAYLGPSLGEGTQRLQFSSFPASPGVQSTPSIYVAVLSASSLIPFPLLGAVTLQAWPKVCSGTLPFEIHTAANHAFTKGLWKGRG